MELLIKLKFYEIKKLQEYICLDRWEGAYGKKKRNQFIYTTYFSNVIYAMRSFVGDTISGTGMADMHRKARISDLCIYDCGRMLLYFECKKIYAATFFICCNFRNTIQLDYGKFCNLPVHQNVLWTFLLGLLSIQIIEKAKKKQKQWILLLIICLVLFMDYLLGTISMVDYNAAGILTVLLFYFFRKKTWVSFVAQFAGMYYLNVVMLGDLYYPVTILGHHFEIPQQSFALLALIPIWLYNREQGYHSKWFKYFCYAFYPAHLLILFIIWQWRIR